jgi:hypothetical protein
MEFSEPQLRQHAGAAVAGGMMHVWLQRTLGGCRVVVLLACLQSYSVAVGAAVNATVAVGAAVNAKDGLGCPALHYAANRASPSRPWQGQHCADAVGNWC